MNKYATNEYAYCMYVSESCYEYSRLNSMQLADTSICINK